MDLNTAQTARAAGVLVGLAVGDALGAGYEFGPALPASTPVYMKGGGPFGFEPSEWTDDTSMALCIAEGFLEERSGTESRSSSTTKRWIAWARTAKDVGAQTRAVLRQSERLGFEGAARAFHEQNGRSAGNGSLMRTAPIGLAHLHHSYDWDELRDMTMRDARRFSALTHFEDDAGDAAALWSSAIAHAVLTGELDIRVGLKEKSHLRGSEELWLERIEAAENREPSEFQNNGWVVEAFQGAWSSIQTTRRPDQTGPEHLRAALKAAVRGGNDTDTVAAIAGSLLGAAYGIAAIPFEWLRDLHGWPRYDARDLIGIGLALATEKPVGTQWPAIPTMDYSAWAGSDSRETFRHPDDTGVLLGAVGALASDEYDAVVSLCRVGSDQAQVGRRDHAEYWLIDSSENEHLDFIVRNAVNAIERFRAEGKTVLLHCVRMESRTPTIAAAYGAKIAGGTSSEALERISRVLPRANPNPAFRRYLAAADRD